MSFRIDPVGAGAPARPLRVKPIPSRRQPSDERDGRREDPEEGATFAPAPEPVVDTYGPRAQGARRTAAPPPRPWGGETTPPWVAALLKAR